ncbi:hypothetical protein GGX14DRAFT_407394 [Mycena pura]|uniref:Uncharacterized protein n=1 Tax=Mycena pura TaxID=153505 RepID=A0AAD6Y4I4_9AGAR|nr:hypothetical protein GGX14DRAFT_407394 [Mycena pura]
MAAGARPPRGAAKHKKTFARASAHAPECPRRGQAAASSSEDCGALQTRHGFRDVESRRWESDASAGAMWMRSGGVRGAMTPGTLFSGRRAAVGRAAPVRRKEGRAVCGHRRVGETAGQRQKTRAGIVLVVAVCGHTSADAVGGQRGTWDMFSLRSKGPRWTTVEVEGDFGKHGKLKVHSAVPLAGGIDGSIDGSKFGGIPNSQMLCATRAFGMLQVRDYWTRYIQPQI